MFNHGGLFWKIPEIVINSNLKFLFHDWQVFVVSDTFNRDCQQQQWTCNFQQYKLHYIRHQYVCFLPKVMIHNCDWSEYLLHTGCMQVMFCSTRILYYPKDRIYKMFPKIDFSWVVQIAIICRSILNFKFIQIWYNLIRNLSFYI